MTENTIPPLSDAEIVAEVRWLMAMPELSRETCFELWKGWRLNLCGVGQKPSNVVALWRTR